MLFPKSCARTAAMKYGSRTESMVKLVYQQLNNVIITETGLIIPANCPWMCFSPDGIILPEQSLIEIKCPVKGQEMTASAALKFCQLITFNDAGKPLLKTRHNYYGQVQLGMFLLNLQSCHFLVYASYDQSIADIEVPRDPHFIKEFIAVLDKTYFRNILPHLSSNYKRLKYFKLE